MIWKRYRNFHGGEVKSADYREFGKTPTKVDTTSPLFKDLVFFQALRLAHVEHRLVVDRFYYITHMILFLLFLFDFAVKSHVSNNGIFFLTVQRYKIIINLQAFSPIYFAKC